MYRRSVLPGMRQAWSKSDKAGRGAGLTDPWLAGPDSKPALRRPVSGAAQAGCVPVRGAASCAAASSGSDERRLERGAATSMKGRCVSSAICAGQKSCRPCPRPDQSAACLRTGSRPAFIVDGLSVHGWVSGAERRTGRLSSMSSIASRTYSRDGVSRHAEIPRSAGLHVAMHALRPWPHDRSAPSQAQPGSHGAGGATSE